MDIYEQKTQWKIGLLIAAALIVSASLLYTSILAQQLEREERLRMQSWAEALRQLITPPVDTLPSGYDPTVFADIIRQNTTIPIITTDRDGKILNVRNFNEGEMEQTP